MGGKVFYQEGICQAAAVGDAGLAESPDGTLTGRYRFLHALYRHVLYEGIGAARRVRLHRAIGLWGAMNGAGGGGVLPTES